MSSSVYDSCVAAGQEKDLVLRCIADGLTDTTEDTETTILSLQAGVDIFFLIFAASLMFMMQAGFAMLCAGCVREKNVQNTLLKNLLDACGAAIAFFVMGFAFAYGGQTETGEPTTFIGDEYFFLIGTEDYAFWLFQFAFAATASTIVAGTLAERCQMVAYLFFSIFLTAFIYPVIAHAVWNNNGFLSPFKDEPLWGTGMMDFAGSGVVHVTGGITALIASKILGPRKGRFRDEDADSSLLADSTETKGHSSTLQALGTFTLWFGWYGFNAGSIFVVSNEISANIAAVAAVSTTLGGASGCFTTLALAIFLRRRQTGELSWKLSDALNGCLAGLVGITGGCGLFEPWAAIVVGGISGVIYLKSSHWLVKYKIDDAVDGIPVHLPNGIWGVIAVGLLASPRKVMNVYGHDDHVGFFYSLGRGSADAAILGTNLVGLLFIIGWSSCIMTPFFLVLRYLGWFRADSLEEIIGLDPRSQKEGDNLITPHHMLELQKRLRTRTNSNADTNSLSGEEKIENEDNFDPS